MGCETGNCPPCKIEVGAINVVPPFKVRTGIYTRAAYHLFILYTESSKQILYRGGPEVGNKYTESARDGRAQEFRAEEAKESWDFDYY